jgi:hypothetical protein
MVLRSIEIDKHCQNYKQELVLFSSSFCFWFCCCCIALNCQNSSSSNRHVGLFVRNLLVSSRIRLHSTWTRRLFCAHIIFREKRRKKIRKWKSNGLFLSQ